MHKQASIWDMIDLGNHQWNFENKNKTLTALCSLHQSQITNIAELFRMLWTFRKHEGLHIFGCMPNKCNIRSWTVTLLEHDFALREHEGLRVLTGAALSVVDRWHYLPLENMKDCVFWLAPLSLWWTVAMPFLYVSSRSSTITLPLTTGGFNSPLSVNTENIIKS